MRWLVLVVLVLLVGCGGPDDEARAPETTEATTSTTEEAPPRSYDELVARLPPLDEPASDEVEEYRRAAFEAFFGRCVTSTAGADKATFEKANRAVLDDLAVFADAEPLGAEYSIEQRDGNGCLENMGPPTSYTTYRTYRLPAGTVPAPVIAHYERQLEGWTPSAMTSCERTLRRGEAYVAISACNDSLRRTAQALPRVEIPAPPKLPPRPYGAQYPAAQSDAGLGLPTSYESEPGETCERKSGGGIPSLIVPPAPGVRAEFRREPLTLGAGTFDEYVQVKWWFDEIHGDCPPMEVRLTLMSPQPGTIPPLSLSFDVRARSGNAQLPVLETLKNAYVLRASATSIDGMSSRSVAILIRRP